ncbi:hypothetical protein [Actinomadura soli]|nr:hypothetical protein [Actinomadura soli]
MPSREGPRDAAAAAAGESRGVFRFGHGLTAFDLQAGDYAERLAEAFGAP